MTLACQKLFREAPQSRQGHQSSQSIVIQEAEWTQAGTREVDATHLVCSTGAIVSIPHLHGVKSCPGKSRLIKCGDWMYIVMIATSWAEKNFNL